MKFNCEQFALGQGYVEICAGKNSKSDIRVWQTTGFEDPNWDTFLANNPGGQFEQTSLWAQVKKLEGWRPLRVVFTQNNIIVAGFQILVRTKPYVGNIGYISKGPVVPSDEPGLIELVIDQLKQVTKEHKIRAAIIHLPDRSKNSPPFFKQRGFMPNHIIKVVDATALINLKKTLDDILKDMKDAKRRNIRKGLRSGIKVRYGSETDIKVFYELMLETCKRQGVSPNPASEKTLTVMWNLFYPHGYIRLFFVEYMGEDVSGALAIPFGDTVFVWKVGWSGRHSAFRPNDVLWWETIKWSKSKGYSYLDLVSIDRTAASTVNQKKKLPENLKKTPAFFKLGFGGEIVLLPESCIYISNPIFRGIYNILFPRVKSLSIINKIIGRV